MPRPCEAEIGVRLLPAERVELHALELALLVVGLVDRDDDRGRARRSSSAASSSAGVMPAAASTTKTMTSASAMARRACSWTRASIGSSGSTSRPPVSTRTNRRPFHSASPYSRSRVVRARSSTIAVRAPTMRLKSVLLPTFGRPTMATTGSAPPSRVVARRRWPGGHASGRAGRPVAAAMFGSEVVRPAGVAARSRAAAASSAACACGRRACRPARGSAGRRRAGPRSASTCRRSRRRRARPSKAAASVRSRTLSIWIAWRAGDLAQPGQLLGVGARSAADDDHQVDLARPAPSCPAGGGS